MCARWLGGELRVEVCVLGNSASDLLERWSFDITSSPVSHTANNCAFTDRHLCAQGVGEDGVTRACRGAEIRGGELVTCISLLHPLAFFTVLAKRELWRAALSLGGRIARQHGVPLCSPFRELSNDGTCRPIGGAQSPPHGELALVEVVALHMLPDRDGIIHLSPSRLNFSSRSSGVSYISRRSWVAQKVRVLCGWLHGWRCVAHSTSRSTFADLVPQCHSIGRPHKCG